MALSKVCGLDESWESYNFEAPTPEVSGMKLNHPRLSLDEFAVGLSMPSVDVRMSERVPLAFGQIVFRIFL